MTCIGVQILAIAESLKYNLIIWKGGRKREEDGIYMTHEKRKKPDL